MIIGSKELIRDINSKLVLETVLSKTPISRAQLSKELGLTKATISTIVQDLIDRNLLLEIGNDNTEFGRKPILLSFNKDAGYALCIDIGVTECHLLLSNLIGESIHTTQFNSPKDINQLCPLLIHYIDSTIDGLPSSPYGIVGITLSIHGVTHDKDIVFTPYYDISKLNLVKQLEDVYTIPIYIENEANLSAIAEHSFCYHNADIASVSIHSGIGLGLIMNHRLVKGYQGYSGEIGHTIINIDGLSCPCGNRGCLEQYVSEAALLKEFCRRKGIVHTSFIEFASYYEKGDSDAAIVIQHFFQYMGVCLNNILNTYNPEIIVINSKFTTYYPEFIKCITSRLTSRMNNYTNIVNSNLADQASLLGGVCVSVQAFLGVKRLKFKKVQKV